MNSIPITVNMTVAETQQQFNMSISETVRSVEMTVTEQIMAAIMPQYDGDYEVIPSVHEPIILDVNGKLMTDDVTVKTVPYYEVSNQSGLTVYIGQNIND